MKASAETVLIATLRNQYWALSLWSKDGVEFIKSGSITIEPSDRGFECVRNVILNSQKPQPKGTQ